MEHTGPKKADVQLHVRLPAFALKAGRPKRSGWAALCKGEDDDYNIGDEDGDNNAIDYVSTPGVGELDEA